MNYFYMALWTIIISTYIIVSETDNIRWIPISLIVIYIIAFFSPIICLCSVTNKSQYNTAIKYMTKEKY